MFADIPDFVTISGNCKPAEVPVLLFSSHNHLFAEIEVAQNWFCTSCFVFYFVLCTQDIVHTRIIGSQAISSATSEARCVTVEIRF